MSGAKCATFFVVGQPARTSRKFSLEPILCSSVSTRFTSKRAKRKNYLRPKILKTLTKPFPSTEHVFPQQTVTNPVIPIVFPHIPVENDTILESPSDQLDKVEEFQVSGSSGVAGEYGGIVGEFSAKSFLKYGLYVVGLFVFQTICAVWVLRNEISEKKDVGSNERNKRKLLLDNREKNLNEKTGSKLSNVIYLDEHELEEKIEEIRAMAREARKIEVKEAKEGKGEDNLVDDFLSSKGRSGIEKEISTRLVSLENRLNSKREKLTGSNMKQFNKFVGENGKEPDSLDAKEGDNMFMFKKKLKFKSQSMNSRSKAKGFPGRKTKSKKNGLAGINIGERREGLHEDGGTREVTPQTTEPDNAEKGQNRNLNSSTDCGENLEKMQKEMEVSHPDTRFGRKETSNRREVGNRSSASKVRCKQPDKGIEFWWLNLPYVLAIFMRRGVDREETGGLFTLRGGLQAEDQDKASYTVAFEDRADANNFCYILESFFEDLGNFSADIVPISTKELHEAVKPESKKVIVVKKRQLKLYAGQPLEDVEMALHSLIEAEKTAYLQM